MADETEKPSVSFSEELHRARIWDIENDRLIYPPHGFEIRCMGNLYERVDGNLELRHYGWRVVRPLDAVDCNGEQVYDGDILQDEDGELYFMNRILDDLHDGIPFDTEKMEVIGNRFENPELIEGAV